MSVTDEFSTVTPSGPVAARWEKETADREAADMTSMLHQKDDGAQPRAFSALRAALVGVALSVAIAVVAPVAGYSIHSSPMTASHFPMALFFGYLLLTGASALLRLLRPRWALSRQEVIGAVAVAFLGSSVPAMMGRLIATISAPHYFASAENQWPDYVLPHLREWAVTRDAAQAITHFYQGLPPGAGAAWQAWVVPLFWWCSFVFAIFVACLSIATILRRQWVERERLAFPLATVPLALTRPEPGVTRRGFLRDRLFWLGASLPLFIILWNMVGYFYPTFPHISFAYGYPQLDITVARHFPKLSAKADFYVFAFAYFTNLNILLSIWFFHLLAVLQIGISNRIGFGPGTFDAGVNMQSFGGLGFFVVWGLYMARSQLADVIRKAWRNDCPVDDSQELVSYRFACTSLLVCSVYLVAWLAWMGSSVLMAILFLAASLILYLGMAKIIAMSGLVVLRGPIIVAGEAKSPFTGAWAWHTGESPVALPIMSATFCGNKGFALPPAANATRLAQGLPSGQRTLGRAVLVGGLLAIVAFTVVTLCLGYGKGAQNFGSYAFDTSNKFPFNSVVLFAKNPPTTLPTQLAYFGTGATITAVLTLLTYRVPWWPLHPIGFTVAFAYPVRVTAYSVFLAWLTKTVVLRVGGISLYRRSQAVVLGMLVGYVLGVAISFLVDVIFFYGQGHSVHAAPI